MCTSKRSEAVAIFQVFWNSSSYCNLNQVECLGSCTQYWKNKAAEVLKVHYSCEPQGSCLGASCLRPRLTQLCFFDSFFFFIFFHIHFPFILSFPSDMFCNTGLHMCFLWSVSVSHFIFLLLFLAFYACYVLSHSFMYVSTVWLHIWLYHYLYIFFLDFIFRSNFIPTADFFLSFSTFTYHFSFLNFFLFPP